MTTYDPREIDWDYWCALTNELFAPQQLGVVPETEWRDWVNGLGGIGYFNNSGVPDARLFEDWRDWAFAFTNIMRVGR